MIVALFVLKYNPFLGVSLDYIGASALVLLKCRMMNYKAPRICFRSLLYSISKIYKVQKSKFMDKMFKKLSNKFFDGYVYLEMDYSNAKIGLIWC